MNKKGFTLVELLAVIIILGIIATITVVSVTDILSTSKDSTHDVKVKQIISKAEAYDIKKGNNDLTCIDISTLLDSGYLNDDEVIDPKTRKPTTGSVKIIRTENKAPSYEYEDNSCE